MTVHPKLELDFRDEPVSHRPVAAILEQGRGRRRRRRAGGWLAVSGVAAAVILAGRLPRGAGGPTDPVSPTTARSVSVSPPVVQRHDEPGDVALYDTTGRFQHARGATVVSRIENPMKAAAPDKSIALAVRWHDTAYWCVLEWSRANGSTGRYTRADEAGVAYRTLAEWVESVVAEGGP